METGYTKDVRKAYIVVETKKNYEKEYQMCMIETNSIPGFLPVFCRGVDANTQFLYEINGKVSMKSAYERTSMRGEEMKRFLLEFWKLQKVWKDYLLDGGNVLLEPEFIFMEKETYLFCYYPMKQQESEKELLDLFEYFIEKADLQDEKSVCLASRLHKAALQSNFHFSDAIALLEEEDQEETEEEFLDEKEKARTHDIKVLEEEAPKQEKEQEESYEILEGEKKRKSLVKRFKKRKDKNQEEWREFFER